MRDISKRYGGVRAIRHADLTVMPGTVHALVGENGAGKSTLIKILSGAATGDTGTIEFDGRPVRIATTGDAMALRHRHGLPGAAAVRRTHGRREHLPRTRAPQWTEDRLGRAEPAGRRPPGACSGCRPGSRPSRSGKLSIAAQQQVSIAKALAGEAKVLILDEPSAILTDAEIDVLFDVVRRLKDSGVVGHLHLPPSRRAVPHRRRGHRHAGRQDHRHLSDVGAHRA